MARVTITLEDTEKEALVTLAMEERRDPRAQAALMLSKELQRLGLLPSSSGEAGGGLPTGNCSGRRRAEC